MTKPVISQGERGLEIHSPLGKYPNGGINGIAVSFIKEDFDTRRAERIKTLVHSLVTKLILEVRQERRTKIQKGKTDHKTFLYLAVKPWISSVLYQCL